MHPMPAASRRRASYSDCFCFEKREIINRTHLIQSRQAGVNHREPGIGLLRELRYQKSETVINGSCHHSEDTFIFTICAAGLAELSYQDDVGAFRTIVCRIHFLFCSKCNICYATMSSTAAADICSNE